MNFFPNLSKNHKTKTATNFDVLFFFCFWWDKFFYVFVNLQRKPVSFRLFVTTLDKRFRDYQSAWSSVAMWVNKSLPVKSCQGCQKQKAVTDYNYLGHILMRLSGRTGRRKSSHTEVMGCQWNAAQLRPVFGWHVYSFIKSLLVCSMYIHEYVDRPGFPTRNVTAMLWNVL